MSKNYIKSIKELQKGNVHIKNPDRVNDIIGNIVQNGWAKLQVVSDFDKTITKQHNNGQKHVSSFGMFRHCPSLTDDYKETVDALERKYAPLEVNPNMPIDEKRVLMEEWWSKSEEALKGLCVRQDEIEKVCQNLAPSLRDECLDLFKQLYDNKVPVLVFSAGLGDTVVAVLKQFNVLLPNVKVISNFLKYDNEGTIQGFQGNIIHIFNKNEYAIKGSEFQNLIIDRDNVLLMGDSLGDASMAEGIEHNNVLKIGFLYEHIQEALPSYMEAFDIVLVDDQTMAVPKAIFNIINEEK